MLSLASLPSVAALDPACWEMLLREEEGPGLAEVLFMAVNMLLGYSRVFLGEFWLQREDS